MRRITQWAGYVLLPFIILILVVFLKWESISYYTLRKAAYFYAGKAHLSLDIGSIDGTPFYHTTFENVSIRPEDGQPQLYQFKTRSISCSFDLWDLRDGFEVFIQGLDCTAIDPEFTYDLRVAAPQDQLDDAPKQFLVPPLLPGLDIHNGSVILTGPGWNAEVKEINSSFRSEEAAQELTIEAKHFRINQGDSTRIETGFTSKLLYSGSQLTIASFEFGEKEISASGLIDMVQADSGLIGFAAEIAFTESRANIAGSIENRILKAQVRTDNFDIGELQKRLGSSGLDVFGNIRGEVELVYNLEAKTDLDGSFAFEVRDGQLNGVDIDAVTAVGNFQNGDLRIAKAAAKTLGNRLTLSNVSVPMSLVSDFNALAILRETQAEFDAEITDAKALLRLFELEDEVQLLPDVPYSLSFQGNFQNGDVIIAKAAAKNRGNRLTLSNVSIPMSLVSDFNALGILRETQAEFDAEITDVQTFLGLLKLEDAVLSKPGLLNSLSLRGNLKNGVFDLDEAMVAAVDSNLTIHHATVSIPAANVETFGSLPINLSATLKSSNITGVITELIGEFPLKGRVSADLNITGSIKDPQGKLSVVAEKLDYKKSGLGSLALNGEFLVKQEKLGTVKAIQLTVNEMIQTNDTGSIALLSPAKVLWQPESYSMSGSFQIGGQGVVSVTITKPRDRELTAEISTDHLDSDGWLANFIDDRYFFNEANIKAVFIGPMKSPHLEIVGSTSEAGWEGMAFPLAGRFGLQYSFKGIEISEFVWESHERNKLRLTGFIPYDPIAPEPLLDGELTLNGHIDFPAFADIGTYLEPLGIRKGNVVMDVALSGSWKQPVGHILLNAEEVDPPDIMKQFTDAPMKLVFDLAAVPGAIVLNSANLESDDYSAQAAGSWQHGFTFRELLQKRKAELRGELAADATVKINDLNFLNKKLPWLRRLEGDMQAEIHVSGAANDPIVTGSFAMKDGEASHTFNLPMLSAVNLQGDFDGHSITIKNMQAEVGGSPVSLTGKIDKVKETVAVDLHVSGKNVLLFRNNDIRMRGDVQLDVSGPLERLMIKGTTGMTGGYYTRNIDFLGMIGSTSAPVSEGSNFLFSFSDPPLRDAVLDIRITTIEPFKIRNNLIRGVLRPELSLKGTGELPFLLGTIYIDPSRILLPSGRLQIQSGLLRFLEGKPDRPQLNILAQSKVLGYDINVVTRGPLDDPVITLSSSPALPNDDLMLLLLTGQPPKQDAAFGTKTTGTTNVMVYLGRDFLNKWLEDESGASDETILDRFELDFGRSVTKSGEQTVESTFRLSKETTGTGKIFYLTSEKDKYDAINYGLKLVFRLE